MAGERDGEEILCVCALLGAVSWRSISGYPCDGEGAFGFRLGQRVKLDVMCGLCTVDCTFLMSYCVHVVFESSYETILCVGVGECPFVLLKNAMCLYCCFSFQLQSHNR